MIFNAQQKMKVVEMIDQAKKHACKECLTRPGMAFHGSLELPEGARVLSVGVGYYPDKTTYVIVATDQGPYIVYNGKTTRLEPVL